ncbi:hypothetical protein RBA71_08255 [Brenneria goodwinii]|uniref:hypothetical protein n=1 Tax=Brenneria goodwinii TaxID=1109412 RepID=UPI0036E443B0
MAKTAFSFIPVGAFLLLLVTLHGRPLPPFDGKTPTLLLASHRNGAADGWIFNQLLPTAQFLTSVQLLRSRFCA